MTPQEKEAKRIFYLFNIQIFSPELGWYNDEEQQKECALICVREIIKHHPQNTRQLYNSYKFFEEVEKILIKEY